MILAMETNLPLMQQKATYKRNFLSLRGHTLAELPIILKIKRKQATKKEC
jgi:hypothetical protein